MKMLELLHKDVTLCGKNVPIKWILIGIAVVILLAIGAAISGCTLNQEDGQNRSLVKASFSIMEGSSNTRLAVGGNTDKIEKIVQESPKPSLRESEIQKEKRQSDERLKNKAMDMGLVNNVKDVLEGY